MNWKIESMVVKPVDGNLTDVVVNAVWSCSASDQDCSVYHYGTVVFNAPGSAFIPYAELTEANVLAWVWGSDVSKTEVETNVARELAGKVNPQTVSKPLPWQSA